MIVSDRNKAGEGWGLGMGVGGGYILCQMDVGVLKVCFLADIGHWQAKSY